MIPGNKADIDTPLHTEAVTATELVDNRRALYGEVGPSFERIALVWSGILGVKVTPENVALCMIGSKAVRAANSPEYSDNIDDIYGYANIFKELVGDDMIVARSTDEYAAKKRAAQHD